MCLFCQIINKEIPSQFVFEDEDMVAFKDIQPQAPVHLLIVPKKHIESLVQLSEVDSDLMGKLIYRAKLLAQENNIDKSGYKLIINTGPDSGQVVEHVHIHLLGGAPLAGLT